MTTLLDELKRLSADADLDHDDGNRPAVFFSHRKAIIEALEAAIGMANSLEVERMSPRFPAYQQRALDAFTSAMQTKEEAK